MSQSLEWRASGNGDGMKRFEFHIKGQIKGGKNNMLMTRTGKHYPKAIWAIWRNQVVRELIETCKPTSETMLTEPCKMTVVYIPEDHRRRDMSAMLDSLFHCMERAGLIEDDSLVVNLSWAALAKNKENAGANIIIEEIT